MFGVSVYCTMGKIKIERGKRIRHIESFVLLFTLLSFIVIITVTTLVERLYTLVKRY